MVALVALRVTIGWHFLYEGVWKIAHPDEFSATPFLTQAKGPAAPLFYAMVHDIDGRKRLARREAVTAQPLLKAWRKICDDARTRRTRNLEKKIRERDENNKKPLNLDQTRELRLTVDKFMQPVEAALWAAEARVVSLLNQNQAAMQTALDAEKSITNETASKDVRGWIEELASIETEFHNALDVIAKENDESAKAIKLPGSLVGELSPDAKTAGLAKAGKLVSPNGKPLLVVEEVAGDLYVNAWDGQRAATIEKFGLNEEQGHQANRIFRRYADSARDYLKDNSEDIAAYFGSLDRFQKSVQEGGNNTAHQKKRRWDEQQMLRAEANAWLDDLDAMGEEYRLALHGILTEEQKQSGAIPVGITQSDLMDFAVTWGLTAIGLCMIVGLCNRLACLGGAAFLVSVLLTQPPWPTIYPPAPEVVGHALIVDKNFVEMIAMLALAALPVGRWGGLDAFLYRWFGQPIMKKYCGRKDEG